MPDANLPGHSETKSCTDCHLSKKNDNNAIMAQLLMQGTNYVNFIGRYCLGRRRGARLARRRRHRAGGAAGGHRQHAASSWRFPITSANTNSRTTSSQHAHEHPGRDIGDDLKHPFRKPEILQGAAARRVPLRGLRRGRRARVRHRLHRRQGVLRAHHDGAGFAARPEVLRARRSTPLPSPPRVRRPPTRRASSGPRTSEPKVHPLYGYIYVADKYEGLILVGAGTTIDGNPLNNFLKREVTFNPDGILDRRLQRHHRRQLRLRLLRRRPGRRVASTIRSTPS